MEWVPKGTEIVAQVQQTVPDWIAELWARMVTSKEDFGELVCQSQHFENCFDMNDPETANVLSTFHASMLELYHPVAKGHETLNQLALERFKTVEGECARQGGNFQIALSQVYEEFEDQRRATDTIRSWMENGFSFLGLLFADSDCLGTIGEEQISLTTPRKMAMPTQSQPSEKESMVNIAQLKLQKARKTAEAKMRVWEYRDDISRFLAQMRRFNRQVGLTVEAWRHNLQRSLPGDILQRISQYPSTPSSDEEYETRLLSSGQIHEELKRAEVKRANRNSTENSSSQKKAAKKDPKRSDKPKLDSASSAEKQLKQQSETKAHNPEEVIFQEADAALGKLPKSVVEKRKQTKDCLRCGMGNHR